MHKTKRPASGPLPTLRQTEYIDGVAVFKGGKHGFQGVKKLGENNYQGCDKKAQVFTKGCATALEAAVELEKKRRKKLAAITEALPINAAIGAPMPITNRCTP